MELKSPWTLAAAWVIAPAAVALACAGLGALLGAVSRVRLGALTLPAGYLAGIAICNLALGVGLGAKTAIAAMVVAAVAGVALAAPWRDRAWRGRITGRLWPASAALGAFLIGMAPLVGSGRSGILGYVLNNDSSVHITAVELITEHGARAVDTSSSSYAYVGTLFNGGYPLGSYAWPLFTQSALGVDAFHTWSPLIALTLAMTALVVYAAIRQLGVARPLAAGAGCLVSCGYLSYSYLAQGGAKEVMTGTAVYGTIALFTAALGQRLDLRALLPTAVGAAAAIAVIGLGAAAWLGPAALATVVVLGLSRERVWRLARAARSRAGVLVLGGVLALLLLAAPAVVASLRFIRGSDAHLRDPAAIGNLVGPVPWYEAFNVWLDQDYRYAVPAFPWVTRVAIAVAAALAILGVVHAVRRRAALVPLAVLAGSCGAIIISARYSIYFDAKTYMALAPALGLATTAGLAWLWSRRNRSARSLGNALGSALALGIIASAALVYSGAWLTPKDRFQELGEINKRFAGRGPMLVNEREDYAKYLLRDAQPWESWGPWQPVRGLRVGRIPEPVPHTPDFDDYTRDHIARFKLLLERKRPGGSLPPASFRPSYETRHYRVWERVGPMAPRHLALGLGTPTGAAALDCDASEVRRLFDDARRSGRPLRVADGREPVILDFPTRGFNYGGIQKATVPGFVDRRGGVSLSEPGPLRGNYAVWIKGSYGPGVRVFAGRQRIGDIFGDLGLPSEWHRVGSLRVTSKQPDIVQLSLEKPWWQSGSRRSDLQGPLAFVRLPDKPVVKTINPGRAEQLCGRSLDWIELT